MSLLSGIKFVPKEKRSQGSIKSSTKKDYSKRKRDHDKKKHMKEKHGKHKRSKKHTRDNKDSKNYDSESSSSDSSIDMELIARKEEEKERRARNYRDPNGTREQEQEESKQPPHDSKDHEVSTKEFDPNHFRNLMNSLKSQASSNDSNNNNNSVEHQANTGSISKNESEIDQPLENAKELPNINDPPNQEVMTNKSAAALLRERLKKTKQSLINAEDNASNLSVNMGVEMDVIALKNRLVEVAKQKLGDSPREEASSKKKQSRSNLPLGNFEAGMDTKQLLSRVKAGEEEDMDEIFRDNVLRLGERYTGQELGGSGAFGNGDKSGMDEDGEIDMKMFQRKDQNQADVLERKAKQAMKSQHQLKKAVQSCIRCTESQPFQQQRSGVVSMGENAYIRMKADPDALIEGHLEILPITHVSSILLCDEETSKEIERFQICLRRMYETQGKGVLFLESAVQFGRRPHAFIDVIPIDRGMEAEASMYFKEAFLSCDEEWAQHRKVIELTAARPLKRAIPSHFQYLSVEWGDPDSADLQSSSSSGSSNRHNGYGGICHPIESDEGIDVTFCLDVVAGMLDVENTRLRRSRARHEQKQHQRQHCQHASSSNATSASASKSWTVFGIDLASAVKKFKEPWATYDWTEYV